VEDFEDQLALKSPPTCGAVACSAGLVRVRPSGKSEEQTTLPGPFTNGDTENDGGSTEDTLPFFLRVTSVVLRVSVVKS
jgi:hypothetical protein